MFWTTAIALVITARSTISNIIPAVRVVYWVIVWSITSIIRPPIISTSCSFSVSISMAFISTSIASFSTIASLSTTKTSSSTANTMTSTSTTTMTSTAIGSRSCVSLGRHTNQMHK
uniref:Candidate secreted effector n=1 Tax=Meloidogyne incognita TaxID=6306 RepID=A0A914N677_MELIC